MSDPLAAAGAALAEYDERKTYKSVHMEHLRAVLAEADRLAAELTEARALLRRVSDAWASLPSLTGAREHEAAHAAISGYLLDGDELRLPPEAP
jgi:hypothetical protein